MLSNFYVFLQIIDRVNILSKVFYILSFIIFVILLITSFICWMNDAPDEKLKRHTKTSTIVFSIALVLFLLIPTKKEVITYYSLKAVDTYNVSVADSNLTPMNAVQSIDGVVATLEDVGSIVANFLENMNPEE